MQYENGKPDTFKYGGCTLRVTLENFRPEVVEKFNRVLAYEKVKEYQKREVNNNSPMSPKLDKQYNK